MTKKLDAIGLFQSALSTLMETSFDDSNNEYMSLSEADAFDFDQVKTTYLNSLGKSEECAKSVDALIEDDSSFAFS